jgi:hypothetical protein
VNIIGLNSKKKLILAHLAIAAVAVSVGTSAFAEVPAVAKKKETIRAGIHATFNKYVETKADLASGYLEKLAKKNLNVLVAEGCDRLRLAGETKLATQLQTEWSHQISSALDERINVYSLTGDVGTMELGDFDPLNAWLDNFYNTLYYKTRGMVKGFRVIHDVYLMNYALAVVLRPHGNWRLHTDYDRIEYRKHFIPFANTVTFWTSEKACEYYLPQFKRYCGNAAGYLEKFMGKHVAPHISDQVFAMVKGHDDATAEMDYQAFENLMMSESETAVLIEE